MLRRLLVAALILLYSLSAIGMPLHFHYCMGELKHVTFLLKAECHGEDTIGDSHGCCGVSRAQCTGHTVDKCCNDATEWLQDDVPALLQKAGSDTLFEDVEAASQAVNPVLRPIFLSDVKPGSNLQISPRPIYLLKCSLIYYG